MRFPRFLLVIPLLVVSLAGCAQAPDPSGPVLETSAPAPAPVYALAVRVTEERPDGTPFLGAQVHIGTLDVAGNLIGSPMNRMTDADGWVRVEWHVPMRVAVQAVAPDKTRWTIEGAHVTVGDTVEADRGLVSERDLFLPLYHATLDFAVGTTWNTTIAKLGEGAMVEAVHADVGLTFGDGLQEPYVARLAKAKVHLTWEDTVTSRAELAAGLAWNGVIWVEGEMPPAQLAPGNRSADYADALPATRPADLKAAHLQAAAVTRSAVVGEVPLAFAVELSFGDVRPSELPDPRCHARSELCVLPLPLAALKPLA